MLTVLSGTEVNIWQDLGIFRADGKFHGYASIRSSDESRPDKGSFAGVVVLFSIPLYYRWGFMFRPVLL